MTLTLTLGCWVFGSVGSGSAFSLVLHMSTYIEVRLWVTQRGHSEGFAQGAHWLERWFYYRIPNDRG